MTKQTFDTLLVGISDLATLTGTGLGRIPNAAVGISGGRIAWVGPEAALAQEWRASAGAIQHSTTLTVTAN